MEENRLYIKNMVCPRCIETVTDIFNGLNIPTISVGLGEVKIADKITGAQEVKLKEVLKSKGFELLEDNKSKLINQIKATVIEHIHHSEEALRVNFSTLLTENLHHDYSTLSRLFSSVEGITIERYVLKQKIEKVKEMIFYKELTFSEIAHRLNYSSVAHLSSQFKKETGMTPTQFRNQSSPNRQSLDSI